MANFNKVQFFDPNNETINFGNRLMAENTDLYESATLAAISTETHNSGPDGCNTPYINALHADEYLLVTIENCLKVFKDQECREIIHSAEFDAIVDTICVSSNNEFLLLCLRNGTVKILHSQDEFQCLFTSDSIKDDDDNTNKLFVGAFYDNSSAFIIVTNTGRCYKICELTDISLSLFYDLQTPVSCVCLNNNSLLVNGPELKILDINKNTVIDTEGFESKRIQPYFQSFVALDNNRKMWRICEKTLLISPIRKANDYKDVEFITDLNGNITHLIAISEDATLTLLSYPGFEKIYSISIPDNVHLISPNSENDEIQYISYKSNTSQLLFHIIYETDPIMKLQRLLKKKLYEEAEDLAKALELDFMLIYKAKAEDIVAQQNFNSSDVQNLIDILDKIDDEAFKIECCLNVHSSCSEISDVEKILSYGLKIQPSLKDDALFKLLCVIKSKFNMYLLTHEVLPASLQSWEEFSEADLFETLKIFLNNGHIEEANILFSRFHEARNIELDLNHINDILKIINKNPEKYEAFLPIFIPVSTSILSSSTELFASWATEVVTDLETKTREFPKNAIKFIDNILSLLQNKTSTQHHPQSLGTLIKYSSAFELITTLQEDYQINISISDCLKGSEHVVKLLLDIQFDKEAKHEKFLKNFLMKFLMKHNLVPNEVLFNHITQIIEGDEYVWVMIIGPILKMITSIKIKMDAIMKILHAGSVPWCDIIRNIACEAAKESHPLALTIAKLINTEPRRIILMNPRYKIPSDVILDDLDDMCFVVKRILYCNEESMVDDIYKLCETPEQRHEANILLIQHFIQNGNVSKAMQILDNNTPEEVLKCAEYIGCYITTLKDQPALFAPYYPSLKLIETRLKSLSKNDYSGYFLSDETVALIQNVFLLENNFQIVTTTTKLKKKSEKYRILDQITSELFERFDSEEITIDVVFDTCQKLSRALSLQEDNVIVNFCDRSNNFNIIYKGAQLLNKSDNINSRNLCLMAILLLKYVGTTKIAMNETLPSMENATLESDNLLQVLQLAQKFVAKALCKAEPDDILRCLEVMHWTNLAVLQESHEFYQDASIIASIQHIFEAFSRFIAQMKIDNFRFLSHFHKEDFLSESEFMKTVQMLPSTLNMLAHKHQMLLGFGIVSTLRASFFQILGDSQNITAHLSTLMNKCIPPLIKQELMSTGTIRNNCIYMLLLLLNAKDAEDLIAINMSKFRMQPKQYLAVSQIGIQLWRQRNLPINPIYNTMVNVVTTMKWWNRFKQDQSNLTRFFKAEPCQLCDILLNTGKMDFKSFEEFIADYDLPYNEMCFYYFKKILLNWKLEYEIKTDFTGRRTLIVKEQDDALLQTCLDVLPKIGNNNVIEIIDELWHSVNRYHHEVFLVMIDILKIVKSHQDNSKKQYVLAFLKHYQRCCTPSGTEEEEWFDKFPQVALPEISEFRLPFTSTLFGPKLWTILRSEMNLNTYSLWIPPTDWLDLLNIDDICTYVIKNVVSSEILKESSETWVLHPKHEDLINQIKNCMQHMVSIERVSALWYYILKYTANGADCVHVAELCYKSAKLYKNQKCENANVPFKKVENAFYNYSAIHILHKHHLAEPRYTDLIIEPQRLINFLYMDERILQKSRANCPDINSATKALAKLYHFKIDQIHFKLVTNWLSKNPDLNISATTIEENIARASYLCEHSKGWQQWTVQLLKEEGNLEEHTYDLAKVAKLLVLITDPATLFQLTGYQYDQFMEYIKKLSIADKLHYFGIITPIQKVTTFNKLWLRQLSNNATKDPLAVDTMALICITYKLYDMKYWEFILTHTCRFSMFAELKTYLMFLDKMEFSNRTFYICAWQTLIDHSFVALLKVSEDQLQSRLIDLFLMLQSSPALDSLNFEKAFEECLSLRKVEFGALLLRFFKKEHQAKLTETILSTNKHVAKLLDDLSHSGIWGLRQAKTILYQK